MSNFKIYTIIFMIIINITLSFLVVWTEHLTRVQYRKLQLHSNLKNDLKTEWKKIRVNQDLYASFGKIERDAKNILNMSKPNNVEYISLND